MNRRRRRRQPYAFRLDHGAQAVLATTERLSDVLATDYDAVFYQGGHGPLWDLAEDQHSINLIETMYSDGRPVAAVCHAPGAFRHARTRDGSSLVQGKSVTGFANSEEEAVRLTDVVPFLVEEMLKQCGGIYSKTRDWQSYVVVDGNLVTGQNPASSEAAAKAVLRQLASRPEVMPIGASIGTPAAGAGASVVSRETHNPST